MLYKVILGDGKRYCMVRAENKDAALQIVYANLWDIQPFWIASDIELLDTDLESSLQIL